MRIATLFQSHLCHHSAIYFFTLQDVQNFAGTGENDSTRFDRKNQKAAFILASLIKGKAAFFFRLVAVPQKKPP